MNRITPIARTLLGLGFVVFATNYFFPFLPAQPLPEPAALAFLGAFKASGLLTFIKVIELAAGLALVANRAVPLALTLLAPVLVGIAGFHVAFDPKGLSIVGVLIALELVLAWSYRAAFAPMLRARVTPEPIVGGTRTPPLAIARG